jgi:hypothetical protein
MNEQIHQALEKDRVIDITTTGRTSGRPSRVEMWFHNLDGEIYISGSPGTRDWYANMLVNPDFTFHLKGSVTADLPARATPITDPDARRPIMARILSGINSSGDLEAWVARSPLVAVSFKDE